MAGPFLPPYRRQLKLLLNFFLTWPPHADCHVPLARHAEIRFAFIDAIFRVFGFRFGKHHARHRHCVLKRHLSVGHGFTALVSNLKPQSVLTRLGFLRLGGKREDQISHLLFHRAGFRGSVHLHAFHALHSRHSLHRHPRHASHCAHRFCQSAFRIQQKCGTCSNFLTLFQPGHNLVEALHFGAELHLLRLEMAVTFFDKHDLSHSRV